VIKKIPHIGAHTEIIDHTLTSDIVAICRVVMFEMVGPKWTFHTTSQSQFKKSYHIPSNKFTSYYSYLDPDFLDFLL